ERVSQSIAGPTNGRDLFVKGVPLRGWQLRDERVDGRPRVLRTPRQTEIHLQHTTGDEDIDQPPRLLAPGLPARRLRSEMRDQLIGHARATIAKEVDHGGGHLIPIETPPCMPSIAPCLVCPPGGVCEEGGIESQRAPLSK